MPERIELLEKIWKKEVAKEIFDGIEKYFCVIMYNDEEVRIISLETIKDLKKKYGLNE